MSVCILTLFAGYGKPSTKGDVLPSDAYPELQLKSGGVVCAYLRDSWPENLFLKLLKISLEQNESDNGSRI